MSWLSGYGKRKEIEVTSSAGAGTGYQVNLSIGEDAGGDFTVPSSLSFPNDLRFCDNDGVTELDYWIEDLTVDPVSCWVEVADDLDSNVDIFCYYGKAGDTTTSNGVNTFPSLFDHFPGTSYDSKWTRDAISGGSSTVSGSILTVAGALNKWEVLKATGIDKIAIPFAVEFLAKTTEAGGSAAEYLGLSDFTGDAWGTDRAFIGQESGSKYYNTKNEGANTNYGRTTDLSSYTRITIIPVSASHTLFYEGGVQKLDATTNCPDESMGAWFGVAQTASIVYCDWVLVRKYISPEPAFASAGAEESEVTPISASDTIYGIDAFTSMGLSAVESYTATDAFKALHDITTGDAWIAELDAASIADSSPDLAASLGIASGSGGKSWLSGWRHRIPITIDADLISEDHVWFPVALFIRDSSGIGGADLTPVFDELGTNNLKLAVTKADGITQLYVEIDTWDAANETAVLHVSKSDWTVTDVGDTVLYLYFDAAQPDNSDYVGVVGSTPGMAVWDDFFVLVMHMNDYDSTHIHDSTHYANHGVKKGIGEPLEVAGAIGRAQSFDGLNDYISIAHSSSLNFTAPLTMECFGKDITGVDQGYYIAKRNLANLGYNLYFDGTNDTIQVFGTHDPIASSNAVFTDVGFVYAAATVVGGNAYFFRNGVSAGTGVATLQTNTLPLLLGTRTDGSPSAHFFNGTIDEVRISNVARSAPWIGTTNLTLTDALLSWGAQEEPSYYYITDSVVGADTFTAQTAAITAMDAHAAVETSQLAAALTSVLESFTVSELNELAAELSASGVARANEATSISAVLSHSDTMTLTELAASLAAYITHSDNAVLSEVTAALIASITHSDTFTLTELASTIYEAIVASDSIAVSELSFLDIISLIKRMKVASVARKMYLDRHVVTISD